MKNKVTNNLKKKVTIAIISLMGQTAFAGFDCFGVNNEFSVTTEHETQDVIIDSEPSVVSFALGGTNIGKYEGTVSKGLPRGGDSFEYSFKDDNAPGLFIYEQLQLVPVPSNNQGACSTEEFSRLPPCGSDSFTFVTTYHASVSFDGDQYELNCKIN